MPFIALSNSELLVEVSDEDHLFLLLSGPFHLAGKGYARTNKAPYQYLHRIVANRKGLSPLMEVDHIDRNKLNSKRDNIRLATRSEQCHNTGTPKTNTSGHKGISFDSRPERRKKWAVRFKYNKKYIHVGAYVSLEEAIQARDAYIKRHNITYIE